MKFRWHHELFARTFRFWIGYKFMKGHGMHSNRLFDQTKEEHASMRGLAPVKPECKFVQVSLQMIFFERPLMPVSYTHLTLPTIYSV